jgi:hypothetical protein
LCEKPKKLQNDREKFNVNKESSTKESPKSHKSPKNAGEMGEMGETSEYNTIVDSSKMLQQKAKNTNRQLKTKGVPAKPANPAKMCRKCRKCRDPT